MRVLVCGSRYLDDDEQLYEVLNEIHETYDFGKNITTIIEGGALGADRYAARWAHDLEVPLETYKADWKKYGIAAGPIRNKQMLDEGKPDLVVAFLSPDSKGTSNMIKQAQEANIPVRIVNI